MFSKDSTISVNDNFYNLTTISNKSILQSSGAGSIAWNTSIPSTSTPTEFYIKKTGSTTVINTGDIISADAFAFLSSDDASGHVLIKSPNSLAWAAPISNPIHTLTVMMHPSYASSITHEVYLYAKFYGNSTYTTRIISQDNQSSPAYVYGGTKVTITQLRGVIYGLEVIAVNSTNTSSQTLVGPIYKTFNMNDQYEFYMNSDVIIHIDTTAGGGAPTNPGNTNNPLITVTSLPNLKTACCDLVGGYTYYIINNSNYTFFAFCGGRTNGSTHSPTNQITMYKYISNTNSDVGTKYSTVTNTVLSTPRYGAFAVSQNHHIQIIGGCTNSSGTLTNSAEQIWYDNNNGNLRDNVVNTFNLSTPFYFGAGAGYPSIVQDYIVPLGGGGATSSSGTSTSQAVTNQTSRGSSQQLTTAVWRCAAASAGTITIIAGGFNSSNNGVNTVNVYKSQTTSGTTKISTSDTLNASVGDLAGVGVPNYGIIFAGGRTAYASGTYSNSVTIFNTNGTKVSSTSLTLFTARAKLAAGFHDQYAIFAGGLNGSGVSKIIDVFDMSNYTYLGHSDGLTARHSLAAVSKFTKIDDNDQKGVIFAGGCTNTSGTTTNKVEFVRFDYNNFSS